MTKPAWKAQNIRDALDDMTEALYGKRAGETIKQDICVACGKPAVEFRDEISRREFTISGLCQSCQDDVFCLPEDE
jgi:hypothetical protein